MRLSCGSMPAKAPCCKFGPTNRSGNRYCSGSKTSLPTHQLKRISRGCGKSPSTGLMPFVQIFKRSHGSATRKERSRKFKRLSLDSSKMSRRPIFRIGIDTGGTFTDFIILRRGKIEMFKELSTPRRPEEAIMKGVARTVIDGKAAAADVIH